MRKPMLVALEDERHIGEMVVEFLEGEGYEVRHTTSAAAAVAMIEAVAGDAILIADRAIGGAEPNGFTVAHAALARHPMLKVIYTSGTGIALRRRVLSGRERILHKPFAMSQLLAAIRGLAA